MIEYKVNNSKFIRVYDDIFNFKYRHDLYKYVNASYFRIGWEDDTVFENRKHRFLHASYSDKDIADIKLIEAIQSSQAAKELEGYKVVKCVVNLSTPSDANFRHIHGEDKILLYYVNIEWEDGWHGETMFFNEDGTHISYASAYTPNRLIAFDPSIPHAIRPQSHIAPYYRFTLAIILNKC